jgi:hypothetical protein
MMWFFAIVAPRLLYSAPGPLVFITRVSDSKLSKSRFVLQPTEMGVAY